MQRLIVLRDRAGNWERPSVTLQAIAAPKWPGAPADPWIEVVDYDPGTMADLTSDPTLLFATPLIRTRLIGPEPLDDLSLNGSAPDWGVRQVGAMDSGFTGAGARVALLDTGIDTAHPAFEGVSLTTRDFVGTGIEDANGHGTHLAGTILGRDVDGTRIGVAPGTPRLIVAKALTDGGQGTSDAFLDALIWAAQTGAEIIGFAAKFDVLAETAALIAGGLPESLAHGVAMTAYRGNLRMVETILLMLGQPPLVLAAVGNDCLRTFSEREIAGPSAPAAARGVLAVGALTMGEDGLKPTPFSNAGPALAAPGAAITSACAGGGLRALNGTSMAMAHAVGVAALWSEALRRQDRPVTAQQLAASLVSHATLSGMDPRATPFDHGKGLVQAP
ncbi:S8 family serine peptidase [Tropicibacter naphthalenivorans]|uniref:Thermophilic serine proteinase n=1 Tax=Tropicibacter naphthalenivorans TaxID=441103 RepID=A0A0P1GDK2_9RHOB|nr:S8 family serine peptidase [Tropicibacter naphthalenivorans]CUH79307.1 Thermophilic serine proteinase precursor [Tropicibacter naphthalenivorans]SMC71248.1 Subtilase family protein [Tropicibacter naphthalenivorans]